MAKKDAGESPAVLRLLRLLSLIPRPPQSATAEELRTLLLAHGIVMDLRSVQRNLIKLGKLVPLRKDGARPLRWSLGRGGGSLTAPVMDPPDALALQLIQQYLEPVMPHALLQAWQPQFEEAKKVLDAGRFRHWRNRVAILPSGPARLPVKVPTAVTDVVYGALLNETQFEADYLPPNETKRHYTFNPLALVYRDGVTYLIAGCEEIEFVPIFALHRMQNPRSLERPVREPVGFDLQQYIHGQQGFEWPVGPKIRLQLRLSRGIAPHFVERPLAPDQRTRTVRGTDAVQLIAAVQDTWALRWWLLSFGPAVEVLAPKALRDEMADLLRRASRQYRHQRMSRRGRAS